MNIPPLIDQIGNKLTPFVTQALQIILKRPAGGMSPGGGGQVSINYQRDGYLPVQRTVDVPWQDFVWIDDVGKSDCICRRCTLECRGISKQDAIRLCV